MLKKKIILMKISHNFNILKKEVFKEREKLLMLKIEVLKIHILIDKV